MAAYAHQPCATEQRRGPPPCPRRPARRSLPGARPVGRPRPRDKLHEIDGDACPVILTTGKSDSITTPELAEATAKQEQGREFTEMKGIGHFPMSENYPVVRGTSADRPAPPRWASNGSGPSRLI
jgi:pimeloyl-ACP methyl ester carboxylesterase